MRRTLLVLVATLIGVTALLSGCSSSDAAAAVRTVPADEFVTAMAQPGTVIVDVRTPDEFAAGHVEGAVNIAVESGDFASRIAQLPTDGTYAVYCRSGRRSTIATDQMADAGFTTLVNLDGGIADLQAAGAPIVAG